MELLLASLAGCATATAEFVFKNWEWGGGGGEGADGVTVESLSFEIEAWRDQRGVLTMPLSKDPPVPAMLQSITGTVKVHTVPYLPTSELQPLAHAVESRCPIANMLTLSGCNLDLKWSSVAPPQTVNILGGGLAGLSLAYHLTRLSPSTRVTIQDPNLPGEGGGSAVAGGLLHPYSPEGKMVENGLSYFRSSLDLIEAAMTVDSALILTSSIYKAALSAESAASLQSLPHTFLDPPEFDSLTGATSFGGVKLEPGVVVDAQSYCKALYKYVDELAENGVEWRQAEVDWDSVPPPSPSTATVFAGGPSMLSSSRFGALPCKPVMGQSLVVSRDDGDELTLRGDKAVIAGKYIAPKTGGRAVVGATQEFGDSALAPDQVAADLSERAGQLGAEVRVEGGWKVDEVTRGVKSVPKRTNKGRMPIFGEIAHGEYVFMGLGSRGFLWHGECGKKLASVILGLEGEDTNKKHGSWWRKDLIK